MPPRQGVFAEFRLIQQFLLRAQGVKSPLITRVCHRSFMRKETQTRAIIDLTPKTWSRRNVSLGPLEKR